MADFNNGMDDGFEQRQKIRNQFTWAKAAELTFKAYQKLGSS